MMGTVTTMAFLWLFLILLMIIIHDTRAFVSSSQNGRFISFLKMNIDRPDPYNFKEEHGIPRRKNNEDNNCGQRQPRPFPPTTGDSNANPNRTTGSFWQGTKSLGPKRKGDHDVMQDGSRSNHPPRPDFVVGANTGKINHPPYINNTNEPPPFPPGGGASATASRRQFASLERRPAPKHHKHKPASSSSVSSYHQSYNDGRDGWMDRNHGIQHHPSTGPMTTTTTTNNNNNNNRENVEKRPNPTTSRLNYYNNHNSGSTFNSYQSYGKEKERRRGGNHHRLYNEQRHDDHDDYERRPDDYNRRRDDDNDDDDYYLLWKNQGRLFDEPPDRKEGNGQRNPQQQQGYAREGNIQNSRNDQGYNNYYYNGDDGRRDDRPNQWNSSTRRREEPLQSSPSIRKSNVPYSRTTRGGLWDEESSSSSRYYAVDLRRMRLQFMIPSDIPRDAFEHMTVRERLDHDEILVVDGNVLRTKLPKFSYFSELNEEELREYVSRFY